MQLSREKIVNLKHPEKNVRKHPQKQIDEMIRSIKMFGQFRPIVVDETNTVLAGNGLVIAMREMGLEEADVVRYDNLNENQKKKLMIADNQVASLGVDDYAAIEEILKSLDGDYDVPGYDEATLSILIEESVAVANDIQSYGTYDAVEVNRLNEVRQDREENGFREVPAAPVSTPAQPMNYSAPYNEEQAIPSDRVYAKPIDEGKYIICPHCGEKIYI